jgi:hypothetical protein
VLFVLASLSLAVGSRVSANIAVAEQVRSGTTAWLLACAGTHRAVAEVVGCPTNWSGTTVQTVRSDPGTFRGNRELAGGAFSVSYRYAWTGGVGIVTNYGVLCEGARLNVNRASRGELAALIQVRCGASTGVAMRAAAAIVDWRDADDAALTGGAESDYYRGLVPAYSCRNGVLATVHELLLIRDFRGPEGRVLFSLAAPGLTVLDSQSFGGTAEGVAHRRDGTTSAVCRIDFAFNVAKKRFEYWYEY